MNEKVFIGRHTLENVECKKGIMCFRLDGKTYQATSLGEIACEGDMRRAYTVPVVGRRVEGDGHFHGIAFYSVMTLKSVLVIGTDSYSVQYIPEAF